MKKSILIPALITSIFILVSMLPKPEKTVPVFKDGQAQIVEGFNDPKTWIKHELWVETDFDTDGDGLNDRMHIFVTRPPQTDTEGLKLPVVYCSSPYFAGTAGNAKGAFWDVEHELGETPPPHDHPEVKRKKSRGIVNFMHDRTWVPRGYIMVYSDSPGTGLSDGSPTIGGENEVLAPKFVIDWLCGRAKGYLSRRGDKETTAYWCTGKVGMTGTSYNGTLALAAATTGVEGLEAIIPIAPNTSSYHYYRSNGLVRSPGGYLGEDVDVLFDFIHSGDEDKRAYNVKTVREGILEKNQDRITGDFNEFWDKMDLIHGVKNIKAAMLMSHGFNDWNVMPEHSYRIYAEAQKYDITSQLYYHQGGHGGPPPMSMMNKWFTRFLHGIENKVEEDPKVWIVREGEKQPTSYSAYPNPEAKEVLLFLNKENSNNGKLILSPKKGIVKDVLTDNYKVKPKEMASDSKNTNRLLYTSQKLTKDVHISGLPEIQIRLASSKKAANLSVYLVELSKEEGDKDFKYEGIITRSWADPQNHKSLSESEDLIPGEFYDLNFKLNPDDQIIPAGHYIGLMIFSSDKDFTLHPKPGTKLTVDVGNTWIKIPIVRGTEDIWDSF